MRLIASAAVTLMFVLVPCQTAFAQSASMPVPGLVVKDSDGKVIGQVAGFHEGKTNDNVYPFIVLNVEGQLAYLYFRPYGLIDRVASEVGDPGGGSVFFWNADCVGDAFVNSVHPGSLEAWSSGVNFGVAGPNPITGEFKLYRSTTLTPTLTGVGSYWGTGNCITPVSFSLDLLPAEEVLPNPLLGFHGPLTLSGGDKLP